jgi:DNA-binding MarR family transcriptional regulator
MERRESEELARTFIDGMAAIMRANGAVFREGLEKYGATFPQLHLMKMVSFHEGTTVSELAQMMMVAPPTASRMIGNLCSRGLLERRKDAADQRVTHIGLTTEGDKILKKIDEQQVALLLELFEGEDDGELKTFIELFDKFTDRWSNTGGRRE